MHFSALRALSGVYEILTLLSMAVTAVYALYCILSGRTTIRDFAEGGPFWAWWL